eukprot:Selendium_serpulae@DN6522_c7_g2_i14.p1
MNRNAPFCYETIAAEGFDWTMRYMLYPVNPARYIGEVRGDYFGPILVHGDKGYCTDTHPTAGLGFAGNNDAAAFVNEILFNAECGGNAAVSGVEIAHRAALNYLLVVGDEAGGRSHYKGALPTTGQGVDYWAWNFVDLSAMTADPGGAAASDLTSGFAMLMAYPTFEVLSSTSWGPLAPESVEMDMSKYGGSTVWIAYPMHVTRELVVSESHYG